MDSKNIGEFQNQEVEEALLYLLLANHKQTKIYIPDIHEDYFFYPNYKEIFQEISGLANSGKSVDMLTIKKRIKNIIPSLSNIIKSGAVVSDIKGYIGILKEHADKRWFLQQCFNAGESRGDVRKTMAQLSSEIVERLRGGDKEKPDVKSIITEFEDYQTINREYLASGNKFIGMQSGFPILDQSINGIRKGHYWVVSAYNNTGKSYFLLNIANRLLNDGKRVVYFSLEMSRVQNIARLLGLKTKIDPTVIERGDNKDVALDEELAAKAELYDQKLTLYTQKRSIDDILVTIYAEHSLEPIDCVMIDYIQKIQANGQMTRYERYTTASDSIQKLCQEISIPVLMASQVDNQTARSKSTDIVATKGSGDIAGDVDFAVLLQKSEEDITILDCFIQKNRHGMKGGCKIKFYDGGNMYET